MLKEKMPLKGGIFLLGTVLLCSKTLVITKIDI